ncbi:CsbD family protein [Paenarthrobacter sp. NPDC089714]|uniref:CsbD family protein n=1 Tax=unclassified Paenarthrobacter TaxID=2634190 RepID=UPI0037C7CE87
MGLGDKIKNAAEELGGKAKEKTGEATGDPELQAEGQGDQASANLKQAGEKVKDAAKDLFDKK